MPRIKRAQRSGSMFMGSSSEQTTVPQKAGLLSCDCRMLEDAGMSERDYTPFNIWQMRNCAGCCCAVCEWRTKFLTLFETHGSIALIKDCSYMVKL